MTLLTPKEGFEINCSDEMYENIEIKAVIKVNEQEYVTKKKKFNLKFLKDLVSEDSNVDGKQINYIIVLHYC
jgi:hypothetical protein